MAAAEAEQYRMGIDVGGTFTDIQILNETQGVLFEHKTPTTPEDPSIGLMKGVSDAAKRFGFGLDQIKLIIHGTTIATNAVLENKMPEAALITTAGFEDVLEIGRHMRRDIYGLNAEKRRLLIPRNRRIGVAERIDAAGVVTKPLDEAEVRRVAKDLMAQGVKVIAICLLNSFRNPLHETIIARIVEEEINGAAIAVSSATSPEIREYERASTTALNAMLMPVVRHYMNNLQRRVVEHDLKARMLIVHSNGGVSGVEKTADHPARLLLSGPCGGAIAAERISELLDEPQLIGVDMGGTSFDIVVIRDSRVTTISEGEVDGCPVRLPMVEIRTIGAGGGSLAWIDRTGRLRVGPQSAGSAPGPACYSRGGEEPTVTDANLALGRFDPKRFLGGEMPLDVDKARAALERHIGRQLDMTLETAAEGIIDIAVSNMAGAIRVSLFEKGLDPGDFALVSFGGAGGLHSVLVAEQVGVKSVIFPRGASTLSAYGMLWSDVIHDVTRSKLAPATHASATKIDAISRELIQEVEALLNQDRIPAEERSLIISLDLRYKGQGYEITIPLDALEITPAAIESAVKNFHKQHAQRFSHADGASDVSVVAIRVRGRGALKKPNPQAYVTESETEMRRQRVFTRGSWKSLPIYRRSELATGRSIRGPLLIEEDYTTLFIPDDWRLETLASGDLKARKEEAAL